MTGLGITVQQIEVTCDRARSYSQQMEVTYDRARSYSTTNGGHL